jgi:hypothetical protein
VILFLKGFVMDVSDKVGMNKSDTQSSAESFVNRMVSNAETSDQKLARQLIEHGRAPTPGTRPAQVLSSIVDAKNKHGKQPGKELVNLTGKARGPQVSQRKPRSR